MTDQLRLAFPAGSRPVATSEDAAASLSAKELNVRRLTVLRLIAGAPRGLTPDEVVQRLGTGHRSDTNKWAPRVTELLKLGLLDRLDGKHGRSTERRVTSAGGTAWVHVINRHGRQYLEA